MSSHARPKCRPVRRLQPGRAGLDLNDDHITEETRGFHPLECIDNYLPVKKAGHRHTSTTSISRRRADSMTRLCPMRSLC